MPHRVATRCRQWVPGTSPGTTTVCVLAAKAAKLRCASKYARRPLRLRTRLAYHRDMTVDPSFALLGALIGVPARANMMAALMDGRAQTASRSEEHTSELPSLMRISYAVLCFKKKTRSHRQQNSN